jgi:hypothetical protein
LTAWQSLLVSVSAGLLGWAYYRAYRMGPGRRRQWVWLGIGTPLALLFWVLPYLTR